jgi:hypothetical protein
MARRLSEGNGGGDVNVVVHDRGPGYIVIAPERIDPIPEQLPVYLSRSVEAWQRDHPAARVRAALPIVLDGMTLSVHIWYD